MSVLKALAQRKHLLFALPALILIFGLTFTTYNVKGFSLTKSIASAATCSGTGCNGSDPSGTGCANDGQTILWKDITIGSHTAGELDMRWSNNCQTNWTRIVGWDGANYPTTSAKLFYISGNCWYYYSNYYWSPETTWTAQYYAPTIPVESWGQIIDHTGSDTEAIANSGWGNMCW